MSIESASNFLVGSILLSVGILVFVAAAVAINNLLFRFWKPVKIFSPDSWKGFNPPEIKSEDIDQTRTPPTWVVGSKQ